MDARMGVRGVEGWAERRVGRKARVSVGQRVSYWAALWGALWVDLMAGVRDFVRVG